MSRSTRVNASPKSFVSVNAVPPVSDASAVSVSCCAASCVNWPATAVRECAPGRRGSPDGAAAGHDGLQPARVDGVDADVGAHRGVDGARSSTWLSVPLRCMPELK